MTDALPLREQLCPIAAEVFATTADAYLLLGDLNEDCGSGLDGGWRPLTKKFARQRPARQLCADADELRSDDFERIANTIRDVQYGELTRSIQAVTDRMPEPPSVCVLSGCRRVFAEAVVRRVLPGCRIVSLAKEIGLQASRCAPAHAIAVLAAEAEGRRKLWRLESIERIDPAGELVALIIGKLARRAGGCDRRDVVAGIGELVQA